MAIGIMWLLALLTGRGGWNAAGASPFDASSAKITDQALEAGTPPSITHERLEEPATRLDLYGNEIEDAVADYRVDVGGTTYESHSPDTALSKLGAPTS